MKVGWTRAWLWWTSSMSVRLWWAVVPLMVVFGIVTLWASKGSNSLVFAGNHNPSWLWRWPSSSRSSSSASIMNTTNITLSAAAEGSNTSTLSSNVAEDPPPLSFSPPKDLHEPLTHVTPDDHDDNPAFQLIKFNTSVSVSPPPKAVEATTEIEKPGMQKEEVLNITGNSHHVNFSLGETHAHVHVPSSARIRKKFGNLGRLEAQLRRARSAIRESANGNQSHDLDYVPSGPMYWNAKAFHRSYLEMEKQFKIYVYHEGEPPVFHNGPCKSIYSMEGNFIYHMETAKFRTREIHKAHVYFLPISVTAIVHFIYDRNLKNHWHPLRQTVKDYVNLVAGKYPYWNRSIGADHFMLSCHDWGPELSKSVPELFKNAIRALCNANSSEGFNPGKDVSIPEINLPSDTLKGLIGGPSPSKRPILAFFAGGVHGSIRLVLIEHWENKDRDIQVQRYLPKGVSYYGMMKRSRFCICPSGYEVASPRIVEALYSGCVPVIIKDHYVPPFSDVLNWKTFSVEIPVNDIPNLKKILSGISSRQYIRMQRRGKQIRRHFELNWPPKRYDVFHMILHSIWLRRLNIRLRGIEDL